MFMVQPVLKPSFQFNHFFVREMVRLQVSDNTNLKNVKMIEEALFMQRLQFGMYSLLADLSANGNWAEIYNKATGIDLDYRPLHSLLKT